MSERRLILGPCRSGTTMLLRSAKNHPDAIVEFQTIKEQLRKTGKAGYDFYNRDVPDGKFLVNKETVGYGNVADCALEVFPDDKAIEKVRPLFIFREPRDTFASWMEQNLVPEGNPRLFIEAYRHSFELLLRAQRVSQHTSVVTYEALCSEKDAYIHALCARWGIAFHQDMIDWKDEFVDSTPLDSAGVEEGHYAAVAASTGIRARKEKQPVNPAHALEIAIALDSVYQRVRELSVC